MGSALKGDILKLSQEGDRKKKTIPVANNMRIHADISFVNLELKRKEAVSAIREIKRKTPLSPLG
jgi:hypothetical protein